MRLQITRSVGIMLGAACIMTVWSCGGKSVAPESRLLSENQPVGQYRGHRTINDTLRSVLLDPTDAATPSFDFAYFAVKSGLFLLDPTGLQPLLGIWTPGGLFGGGDPAYNNGAPTALSAYLYEAMMANLSERLGLACSEDTLTFAAAAGSQSPQKYLLQRDFVQTARAICTATNETEGRTAARNLWHLVVGYEFDESFETLFDLILLTPDYATFTPEQRLELLMHTVLLHPVFLLSY